MYTVYVDDKILYSPDMPDAGYIIENAILTKEINKAGSFEFEITTINKAYPELKELVSRIHIFEDNKMIWTGRVLHSELDFNNIRKVYCEGALSYFNDSIIPPYGSSEESKKIKRTIKEQFEFIIETHNAWFKDYNTYKQFKIGLEDFVDLYKDDKGESMKLEWEESDYTKPIDQLNDLLDKNGGYFTIEWKMDTEDSKNKFFINYTNKPGKEATQRVNFGENLLDMTRNIDPEEVVTVLFPVGYDASDKEITIESVNDGEKYIISAEGLQMYGYIVGSYTEEKVVSTPAELLEKAKQYLNKCIGRSYSFEISAVDLHTINMSIEAFEPGDIINVISAPHGINVKEMCTKVVINFTSPEQSELTIGTPPEGLT